MLLNQEATPNSFGWELVERKTLAAGTTTVTFNNLNSSVDPVYLIRFDLALVASGADRFLTIRPNAITTNQRSILPTSYATSSDNNARTDLTIARSGWSRDGHFYGQIEWNVKPGNSRIGRGQWVFLPTDNSNLQLGHSAIGWTDTSTNITYLDIVLSGGSISGIIEIYRLVGV